MMKTWMWITWVVLGASLLMSAGCGWLDRDAEDDDPFLSMDDVFGQRQTSTVELAQLVVYFVELPIGTSEEAGDIWSQLQRPAMDVDDTYMLSDNGLEIGVGRRENWDRFQETLLNHSAVQYSPQTLIGRPGLPLRPRVAEHASPQTLFLVHQDQTLSGWDFPAGEYLLSILFKPAGPDGQMVITGVPVIRSRVRRAVVVESGENVATHDRPLEYSLNPLAFQMRIPADSFLVIGPSARAQRTSSLGRCFLRRERGGVPVETMLLLVPEFVEREVDEGRAN
jgi:hypothetical protein